MFLSSSNNTTGKKNQYPRSITSFHLRQQKEKEKYSKFPEQSFLEEQQLKIQIRINQFSMKSNRVPDQFNHNQNPFKTSPKQNSTRKREAQTHSILATPVSQR